MISTGVTFRRLLLVLVAQVSISAAFQRTLLGSDTGNPQAPVLDETVTAIGAGDFLLRQSATVSCTADAASKRTCLFNNVCLIPVASSNSSRPAKLVVLLPLRSGSGSSNGSSSSSSSSSSSREKSINTTTSLLRQHLEQVLAGQSYINGVHISVADTNWTTEPLNCSDVDCVAAQTAVQSVWQRMQGNHSGSSVYWEEGVTLLWRPNYNNQESFGHMLINEVYPLFMVLSNHFSDIPQQLQLIVSADGYSGSVLPHMLARMITHKTMLWKEKLELSKQHGRPGICIRHLLLGDGGYIGATRASLSNSGLPEAHTYSVGPSFFSNKNWLALRAYTMQVAGVVEAPPTSRPLILLNDKRFHELNNAEYHQKNDRRMILDIDSLANSIQREYPQADVVAGQFRDLSWPDQLRLLSQASVFITTQGSSAFRWVWLRPGATVVVLGAPEEATAREWRSFHELDKWFPLHYISFERYHIDVNNTEDYVVSLGGANWRSGSAAEREWWLYNSDVRVQMSRLRPMLNNALGL